MKTKQTDDLAREMAAREAQIRAEHAHIKTPEDLAAHRQDPSLMGSSDPAVSAAEEMAALERAAAAEAARDQQALAAGADPATGELPPAGGAVAGRGIKASSAWAIKNFLPGDPDWLRMNVLTKPTGTEMLVGQITGVCTKFERTTNAWGDKQIAGITLEGVFMGKGADGKESSFTKLFLPRAYAEQIVFSFEHEQARQVQIDIDCGIKVTGKTIPYEWTIVYYSEGRAIQALRQRLNARQLGQAPTVVWGGAERKAIEGTASTDAAAD